jgi:hypothetical protein
LDAMKETKAVYVVIQNKRNVGIVWIAGPI